MPSGPKKRRAAAKKKEQAEKSSSLTSLKLQDEISNQETAPVSNTEVVVNINNPVLSSKNVSEDVVVGQCVSPFIEAVEKPGSEVLSSDESVHVESNRAVGSESLASDLLTSNEPVKNIDHESDQSDEKAGSEMLASSDLLINNEQLKNTADDVDHELNQTVAKSGSEKVASGFLTSNEPVKNTADDGDHELNQTLAKLGSEKMASGFLTSNELVKSIVGEIDHKKSNQSDEKAGSELQFSEKSYSMTSMELQDEISNQGTFSVSLAEDFIHNPVLRNNNLIEDVVGKELVQIAGDKSVDDESNRAVGSESLSSDSVVTSIEPVQVSEDKSVDDESNRAVGSESLASDSVVTSIVSVQVSEDKSVHDESNRAVGSESLAFDMLASNEPVEYILDEIDHESNQSVEKALSELAALDLLTTSNEPVKNTAYKSVQETNEAVENAESESLASDINIELGKYSVDKSVNETNQAVEKAESEMIASELLINNEEVKRNTDDVDHEPNQTVAKDHQASDSRPAAEIIHAIAENTINDGPAMMPEEEASVQLLIEKPSPVQISCDPDTDCYDVDAILNKLISDSPSTSRIKRVKEIIEKALMETEKSRLVLKKALDQLTLAIHPDEAAA